MNLRVASYIEQVERWPKSGRQILAQYDDDTIIVYQVYVPADRAVATRIGISI